MSHIKMFCIFQQILFLICIKLSYAKDNIILESNLELGVEELSEIPTIATDLTVANLNNQQEKEDLVLVHALFRHGERTPDAEIIYPKDPYINETYYPYGYGQITKKGKITEYNLGNMLGKRYHNFLGDIWTPDVVDAWSTNFTRTKMSLELVLAALFPPEKTELLMHGLNWQPIPYSYKSKEDDQLLGFYFSQEYWKTYDEFIQSKKMQYYFERYKNIFGYISINTGWNVTSFSQIFELYFTLKTEEEWGLTLPEWTKSIYPSPLTGIAVEEYKILTGNLKLRKLASGMMLQKIVLDGFAKLTDTIKPRGRKMFLYSAHEVNIGTLLNTLNVFDVHIPPYGSCVLFELHQKDGNYGYKIFYQNYTSATPHLLKLPDCEEFCPFSKFTSLVKRYFPEK